MTKPVSLENKGDQVSNGQPDQHQPTLGAVQPQPTDKTSATAPKQGEDDPSGTKAATPGEPDLPPKPVKVVNPAEAKPPPPDPLASSAAGVSLAGKGLPRLGQVALPDGKTTTPVPVDIKEVVLDLKFDVRTQQVTAKANVTFDQETPGAPVLNLGPQPSKVKVDGQAVAADKYARYQIKDLGPQTPADGKSGPLPLERLPAGPRSKEERAKSEYPLHRVLEKSLGPGRHTLEVTYQLDHETLKKMEWNKSLGATRGGMKFAMRMMDLGRGLEANFLDTYAPGNLEFDQHPTVVRLRFEGATRKHAVFTNGEVRKLPGRVEAYEVRFPANFNSSMPYLHVTDPADVAQQKSVYRSKDGREIPIIVYSDRSNYGNGQKMKEEHQQAIKIIQQTMAEMEDKVGPYLYDKFVARIRPGVPVPVLGLVGGMEYAGATETDVRVLRHELVHSWFGRGVLPAHGATGWLDEALTTWIEIGMPRSDKYMLDRMPDALKGKVNLQDSSAWQRGSGERGYDVGVCFVHDLDLLLRSRGQQPDGILPALRQFYAEHKGKSVTPEDFIAAVRRHVPPVAQEDFKSMCARYGYPEAADPNGTPSPVVSTKQLPQS